VTVADTAPTAAPKRPSLFQIGEDMRRLDELLTACDGDISDPAVEAHVTEVAKNLADAEGKKLDGILWYIRQTENQEAAVRAQSDQLAQLVAEYNAAATMLERRQQRLKLLVKTHLERTNRAEATSEAGVRFTVQKNGGAPSLKVSPGLVLSDLPDELKTVRVGVNAEAVKAALKAGKQVPGCELVPVTGTHLRIRV